MREMEEEIEDRAWIFAANDAKAVHEARHDYMSHLHRYGRPDSDFHAAELVFGELVGNVLHHGEGNVEVRLEWGGDTPALRVSDDGPGFQLRATLPKDVMSEKGRGLYLATALTQDLRIFRNPNGGAQVCAVLPVYRVPKR